MVSEIVLHLAGGRTFRFNRVDGGFDIYEMNQEGWEFVETAPAAALDTFIKLIKLNYNFYS